MFGAGNTMKEAKQMMNTKKTRTPYFNVIFYFGIGLGFWVEDYTNLEVQIASRVNCFLLPFCIVRKGYIEFDEKKQQ